MKLLLLSLGVVSVLAGIVTGGLEEDAEREGSRVFLIKAEVDREGRRLKGAEGDSI